MIKPTEIKQKALKLWSSGRILQANLRQKSLFPWEIKFKKPTSAQQIKQFSEIKQWIALLQSQARDQGGYHLIYKTIQHRQLGEQAIPWRIVFPQQSDLLIYIGKQTAWDALLKLVQIYPALQPWISKKPALFMQYADSWHDLLLVCDYFIQNPRPNCYLRELEIPQIETKFIEGHRKILVELFDFLLPKEAFDQTVTGLAKHGFERRYGLKYDPPLIRFRFLDPALSPIPHVNDISLPLSQLAAWHIPCKTVFISENKINGLSFPAVTESLIIFGLGYGIDCLKEIPWLSACQLYYWGDIDSHGLSILNRLRQYFPQVIALMMDQQTLMEYQTLAIIEPPKSRCQARLTHLNSAEQTLYQQLQHSHQRLEQERIPMKYVKEQMAFLT